MSLLVDWQIRMLSMDNLVRLLDPFNEAVSGNGVISYGLTHAGYDLRLSPEGILQFCGSILDASHYHPTMDVDPKKFKDEEYRRGTFQDPDTRADGAIRIPPGGYILGRSVEYIRMPSGLSGTCVGKSTYARSGIIINTTPLEPGWHGYLTIEIGNICSRPAVVYPNEGIAQLRFEHLPTMPETTYEGKKYQGQTETTPARVH